MIKLSHFEPTIGEYLEVDLEDNGQLYQLRRYIEPGTLCNPITYNVGVPVPAHINAIVTNLITRELPNYYLKQ